MKILVIGNGGREHALAWACKKDATVFMAPSAAFCESGITQVDLNITDPLAVIDFCQKNAIDCVLVGPEAPLVAGLVDDLETAGIYAFGAKKACARLEGSKSFAKDFMARHRIPTAACKAFTDLDAALDHLKTQGAPIVIKADGLAAGKGVVVAMTLEEANEAVTDMLEGNRFGDAGARVVIEEYLEGEEASFICMVAGDKILPMATSQDHKRIFDADKGPNTGGMGAYSPAPVVTKAMHQTVMERIIVPTVRGMIADGTPYTGFLYAGLMIQGDCVKVIEFNCRFGDPETQPIMMRLKTPLPTLLQRAKDGDLPTSADWDTRAALGVVLAAPGYPNTPKTGAVITGIGEDTPTTKAFFAGVGRKGDAYVTKGGRVLCACALGDTLEDAKAAAYARADAIDFAGKQMRRDIGDKAIKRP